MVKKRKAKLKRELKARLKLETSAEGLMLSAKEHMGKLIDRLPPLKTVAFLSSTYLFYNVLENTKVVNAYEDIQLFGSPLLFALKKVGLFDPFRAKEDILDIRFGKMEKLAFSMVASYVLVEHGDDVIGLLKKVPLAIG